MDGSSPTVNPESQILPSSPETTAVLYIPTPPITTTATYSSSDYSTLPPNVLLIGLSPQFWAYTPLLIADLHRLYLDPILGVDCILSSNSNKVPISKCKLVGWIVCIRRISNAVFYVIDDGTGCIDCISWGEDSSSLTSLPSLVPKSRIQSIHSQDTSFQVGDFVEIYGTIKLLYVSRSSASFSSSLGTISCNNNHPTVAQDNIIREVHIRIMESCDPDSYHSCEKDPKFITKNKFLKEPMHWFQCIRLNRRIQHKPSNGYGDTVAAKYKIADRMDSDIDDDDEEEEDTRYQLFLRQQLARPVLNGQDSYFNMNGHFKEMIQQKTAAYLHSSSLYQKDDANSDSEMSKSRNKVTRPIRKQTTDSRAWKFFGIGCPCRKDNGIPYKYALLYCHCMATKEALDPNLIFRDALLIELLEMEKNLHSQSSDSHSRNVSSYDSSCTEPCNESQHSSTCKMLLFNTNVCMTEPKSPPLEVEENVDDVSYFPWNE